MRGSLRYRIPHGGIIVTSYHSHPEFAYETWEWSVDPKDGNVPSEGDKIGRANIPGVLITPGGRVETYDTLPPQP